MRYTAVILKKEISLEMLGQSSKLAQDLVAQNKTEEVLENTEKMMRAFYNRKPELEQHQKPSRRF